MRAFFVAMFWAMIGGWTYAELNTVTYVSHDGGGDGRVEGDTTGVGKVTLYDGPGGDMWNGGDQFIYLHDENKVTGDFSATVRVVAQTESVSGRWGKSGPVAVANLSGNGQMAMTAVVSGTGSQIDPPAEGGHNPVPVRIHGRRTGDGQNGFEPAIRNSSGEIMNNVFPESDPGVIDPPANVSWLRLQYQESTNTFLSAFAPDVDGEPGEWGYSPRITDVDLPTEDDGPGWYVGLGYSVHGDMDLSNVADEEGMHGVSFDNYSIVSEFLPQQVAVAGLTTGTLELAGDRSELEFGNDAEFSGLSQYWYDANMRNNAEAFLEAGLTGTEDYPLLNPTGEAIVSDTTWWRGSQGDVVSDLALPNYPAGLAGTRFENSTNENDYSVRLTGEIFFEEDGEYLIRDGVDDFTMVAIDADGNGELDDLDSILNADIGQVQQDSIGDVHVLDDDWANLDGSDQALEYHGIAEIEGIAAGGEWRKIEIWTAEGGGGDGGILYVGNLDDPDIFDDLDGGALSQEQRDKFVVRPEQLRTTIPELVGGKADAALDPSIEYIMQVNSDGSDQIVVDDRDGVLTTSLDVSGATVVVREGEGLEDGAVITLFDVDTVTGLDSFNLVLEDESQWDLSGLSNGQITFGVGTACDPNTMGDIDGSGDVGFADFLILSDNFGQSVADHRLGDIDCSGEVAFADFLILSDNFGDTVGGAQAVPEPSSSLLSWCACIGIGCLLRRRRR